MGLKSQAGVSAREEGSLIFLVTFVLETVSLCSPGYLGTHSVDLAGLELTEIPLPLPPKGWDQIQRRAPPWPGWTLKTLPSMCLLAHSQSRHRAEAQTGTRDHFCCGKHRPGGEGPSVWVGHFLNLPKGQVTQAHGAWLAHLSSISFLFVF